MYALCAVKHKSDLLFMGLQPHRSQMLGAIGGGRGQGVNLLSCEAPAPFLDNQQVEESDTGKRVLCVFNRERKRKGYSKLSAHQLCGGGRQGSEGCVRPYVDVVFNEMWTLGQRRSNMRWGLQWLIGRQWGLIELFSSWKWNQQEWTVVHYWMVRGE